MRPYNPMINAGAIAIASLMRKKSCDEGVRTSSTRCRRPQADLSANR